VFPDGRVQPLVRAFDAPEKLFTDATARQYLRMYVETCERYRYDDRTINYNRCALLLTPEQQKRYAEWFGPTNPQGFQGKFGRTGSVFLGDDVTYTKYAQEGRTQIWTMRFVRVEVLNQQVACRRWQATVTFQFRPELEMSDKDRDWNLAGLQISDRVSQPDPSAPTEGKCV
jgi:type IV secretory pathway component VirB8